VLGECPNACSGHGSCSLHDQCECCRNWQANDCSERTCPFGYAHVDTPKGDIDLSGGALKAPNKPLLIDSTVYPQGTVEQYPASWPDEGHFYMECSNKGLCERESGLCQCFPGYDGTACQRASCPNDCSGHGTCETIKELAEDKERGDSLDGYDAGMTDLSGIGGLNYDLWDKTLTMGCKCDAGYNGADCSLRSCRFGVDPLFIPKDYEFSSNNPFVAGLGKAYASATANAAGTGAQAAGSVNQLDAPSYEQSFVEISSESHLLHGTFDLTLYDVYGDKFVLDGLEYGDYASPNFEGHMPVGAGGVSNIRTADPAAIGTTSGLKRHPFLRTKQHRGGGASNFTTCFEIMQRIPNRALKDTLGHGTYHHGADNNGNNMPKNYGGLVGSAYVNAPSNMRPQTPGYYSASSTHAHVPHSYYIAKTTPFCNATYPLFSAYGIRYDFNYGRGNPGYHKDLYINNVMKDLDSNIYEYGGADAKLASPAGGNAVNNALQDRVMAFGYYATDRQGEVAEYLRQDLRTSGAAHTADDFGLTLPGYVQKSDAANAKFTMSGDVLQYVTVSVAAANSAPGAVPVSDAAATYPFKGDYVWYEVAGVGRAYEISAAPVNEWYLVDGTKHVKNAHDGTNLVKTADLGLTDAQMYKAAAGAAGGDAAAAGVATPVVADFKEAGEEESVGVKTRRTVITVKATASTNTLALGIGASTNMGADVVNGKGMAKLKVNLAQVYQYVTECSNRGTCVRESGTCLCYAGYTHDNCDTQAPVC
jgi:hypothetical protein